jgi:hypothetical protein
MYEMKIPSVDSREMGEEERLPDYRANVKIVRIIAQIRIKGLTESSFFAINAASDPKNRPFCCDFEIVSGPWVPTKISTNITIN